MVLRFQLGPKVILLYTFTMADMMHCPSALSLLEVF